MFYYVDANGNYKGGWSEKQTDPAFIEVPYAPDDAFDIWDGSKYIPSGRHVRQERDRLIAAMSWRLERNAREQRLGLTPTDDIAALDAYMQALADIPQQVGFPDSVTWPTPPA